MYFEALEARDRRGCLGKMSDDLVRLCLVSTPHSINTLFRTTMSDPNLPGDNRLKGKFKGLLDRLMGADHLRIECPRPSGSRLEFMAPTLADSMLMKFRSTYTGALEVTGEGTSLVCVSMHD